MDWFKVLVFGYRSENYGAVAMQDVFISYSRKDRAFIDRLVDYLNEAGFSHWLDTDDLHPAAIWRDDLKTAIIESDNLIFTISPASIDSEHCRMELEFAAANNKRIIPIVYHSLRPGQNLPEALNQRQWLAVAPDDGNPQLEEVGAAIRNEYHWRKQGSDYLRRSENWQSGQGGVLARVELESARDWLEKGAMMRPGPSERQIRYIHQSEAHHLAEAERWQALYAKTLARQLAAQALVLIDQRGILLETAALLAVESMRRFPTLEGDRALRKALWLLPKEVARMEVTDGTAYRECAFSADGRYVATFGNDNMVRVWACGSGRPIAQRETAGCRHLCFCPQLTHLAILDGPATIWDWEADTELTLAGDAEVRAAAYSPEGGFFVTAGSDLVTRLWDVEGYEELAQYQNAQLMHGVAIAPDAREVITHNTEMAEFFRSPGSADQTMEEGIGSGSLYQFSPDGKQLSQVDASQFHAFLYDTTTKAQLIFEERHWHAAFSGNGQYYALASPEWDAHAYDLHSCNQAGVRMVPKPGTATFVREYVHGRVSCKRGNSVRHDDSIRRVALSHSGRIMGTTSRDGTARVWETYRGREILRLLEKSEGGIRRLAFGPGEKIVTGWGANLCRTWEAEGHRQVAAMKHHDGILGLAFSGDGRFAATISQDGTAGVWSLPDGREVVHVDVPGHRRQHLIALDGDGSRLMVGKGHLFSLPSGDPIQTRLAESPMAALSPDWKWAVIAKPDEVIVAETDQLDKAVARCSIVQGLPNHMSFSADGEWLAWVSDQGTAWAWHWRSQAEPRAVAPGVKVRGGRLDATGRLMSILDTVDKRIVHIWEMATGEPVSTLRHEADVTAMAFNTHGDHVAVASVDYTVRVWRLDDSAQIAEFRHDADVQAVAFSPDDRCVFSAGGRSDRTARLWYWRPSDLLAEACARLDRDLTEEEWDQYLVGEAYRPTRQMG